MDVELTSFDCSGTSDEPSRAKEFCTAGGISRSAKETCSMTKVNRLGVFACACVCKFDSENNVN